MYDDRPEYFGLPIGALEQDPGGRPKAHIYVASNAPAAMKRCILNGVRSIEVEYILLLLIPLI